MAFFDHLLKLLHPFIPFITEELWQALEPRKDGESIMYAQWPELGCIDENLINDFENTKEIIAGIRTIRLQKNIANKVAMELYVKGQYQATWNAIIEKISNIQSIRQLEHELDVNTANFLVGTTEFIVPIGDMIDKDKEIEKIEADIKYYEGFLLSVMKKLGNEKFVAHAKPEVVELERKKKSDAESKLATLKESLNKLKS